MEGLVQTLDSVARWSVGRGRVRGGEGEEGVGAGNRLQGGGGPPHFLSTWVLVLVTPTK